MFNSQTSKFLLLTEQLNVILPHSISSIETLLLILSGTDGLRTLNRRSVSYHSLLTKVAKRLLQIRCVRRFRCCRPFARLIPIDDEFRWSRPARSRRGCTRRTNRFGNWKSECHLDARKGKRSRLSKTPQKDFRCTRLASSASSRRIRC